MVPPPSAVTAASTHTPNQSILRRPAASAAVMASAAMAITKITCSMWLVAGVLDGDDAHVDIDAGIGLADAGNPDLPVAEHRALVGYVQIFIALVGDGALDLGREQVGIG